MIQPQIIIVGAGAAGLAAAQRLCEAGCTVLIIEARSRIGGRILTVQGRALDLPLELGAEFIHGRPKTTWKIIRAAGLCAYDLPFAHLYRRGERLVREPPFMDELARAMNGLAHLGRRDISFADYLAKHEKTAGFAYPRRIAQAFVEGFDAADPQRISAHALADEQDDLGDLADEPQFRLLGGYGALIDYLRESLDRKRGRILLSTSISEINWQRTQVQIRCRRGSRIITMRSPRAIITLPLGVLQIPPEMTGAVRFSPEISEKRRAVQQLGSGGVVKAILKFHEPFWENPRVARSARAVQGLEDASFLHDLDMPFPTWWTSRPLRLPVLTAWAGGPKAAALSGLSRRTILEAAMLSLSSLLGQRKARLYSLLHRFHHHDWPADPFARGAYSYVTVGGVRARSVLARPIENTLFFAGEATDTRGQASTVAGALASGQRAARELLAAL